MAENPDYEDILSGTVSEAKSDIRDLDDPDYRKLLQLERENKNRKTLKEFLEERVEDEESEEETVEEVETTPVADEEVPDTLDRNQMLAGGFIIGVLVGLVVGAFALGSGMNQASSSQVTQAVQDYVDAVVNATPQLSSGEVTGVTRKNGLYLVNVTVTTQIGNQTRESVAGFYVTGNGKLMFPAQSATNLEVATRRLQRQPVQPQPPQTNTTR